MKKWIFFFLLASLNLYSEELSYPYNDIEVLPYNPHGWHRNSNYIEALFREKEIKVVVEVGSWLGASARQIATLLPEDGVIYAVDHWLGNSTQQLGKQDWRPELPYAYQQFLSNVIHTDLTEKIVPIRMNSLEAAKALNVRPDMVYIDAEHTEEAVYVDLCAWYPFVKGHGILCGDDWGFKSVMAAVRRFAKENNLRIYGHISFWRLIED